MEITIDVSPTPNPFPLQPKWYSLVNKYNLWFSLIGILISFFSCECSVSAIEAGYGVN